ncbi:MAG: hypothetical protein NC408_09000 [Candidatus Gastranaerophilales bacterium]|nr:hypothetical protein [Candidatus Gastranaerophilales bacterium]MCM1072446.1 hypothetical protein [Bacteroides sp.]
MFEALAGSIMAMKVHFSQMNLPFAKRKDRVVAETIYQNNVNKVEVTEKYEKSKMPESGYMTVAEYEAKSRAKSKKEIIEDVKEPDIPKDSNMVYVPQKTFKLVKYNDPIGSPELTLPRKLNFDRQINAQGIISGDKTMLVYPAVYYYAQTDCTSCDLFLIKLNSKLNDTDKAMKANIVQREEEPLISTSKDIETKFIFRTLTPIDFSADNKKLVVKEKVGHRHDGIWKTDLWVYDFEKREAKKLPQIREAIIDYWANSGGVDFEENRWDIYPMGFDANNDNRVILCAYAYTGEVPKFLGTWSIDVEGVNSKLEDLSGSSIPVSVIGFRLAEDSVKDSSEIEFEARQAKEREKAEEKQAKEAEKFDNQLKDLEYKRKIHQMDMETLLKIQQRKNELKNISKPQDGLTGAQ